MPFGVLPEGFFPESFEEMRADIDGELKGEWGSSIPLGDGTFIGHVIAILCERLVALWELGEISFNSYDPDSAAGVMQRVLGLITGTVEIPPAGSTVTAVLCGDDGTIVNAGNVVSTASTGKRFASAADVTIEQLDAWLDATAYAVGERVTSSNRCYECITAGVSADAPTTTAEDIVDGTVHWTYLGEGEAAVDVVMVSEDLGEIVAAARDLTSIETPIAGWNTARNLLDAALGRLAMTDEQFAVLREEEIHQPGTGTPDAIRAAILSLSGVTNCTVFYNNTDETTVDGLTPHSCEVLVQGGADQDIWDMLWDNVPVGIATVGTEEGFATDDEGTAQAMAFSRPEELAIWIIVTLEKEAASYAGDVEVEAAIVEWGAAQPSGKNVVASAVGAQAWVDGVLDVSNVKIGLVNPPVASATIVVTKRQLATFDTGRVSLITTNGTP